MSSETEAAHVQPLPAMELGGFEPPTSWVRSRLTNQSEIGNLQVIRGGQRSGPGA